MKDLYLEITFWIGALTLTLLMLIGVFYLFQKLIDIIVSWKNVLWNVYEYAVYKKEFNKWLIDNNKKRHKKSIVYDNQTK